MSAELAAGRRDAIRAGDALRDSTGEAGPWGGRAGAGRRTMVLILPFSVVMLSRWCRWAKGLAAPHDSRYRVMRTDALILAPSSVWRGLNRCCGLRRSPWGQETERHLLVPQAHACSPPPDSAPSRSFSDGADSSRAAPSLPMALPHSPATSRAIFSRQQKSGPIALLRRSFTK